MRLLAVDTSTPTEGVAALDGETARAVIHTTSAQTHARRLMSTVDSALTMAGMTIEDCDGFAVTVGPGSFTGLRIGISAVKGFALATNKPVVGVSTLEALAAGIPGLSGRICPLLDARKGQVYAALYQCGGEGLEVIEPPRVVDPEMWLRRVDGPCLFVGDGVGAYRHLIEERVVSGARFAPPCFHAPNACVVGRIGIREFERGNTVPVDRLTPLYIRKSDAEIKLEKGMVAPPRDGSLGDPEQKG